MDKYYLLVDIDGTLADCTERAKKFLDGAFLVLGTILFYLGAIGMFIGEL